jgi:hypothetical protein
MDLAPSTETMTLCSSTLEIPESAQNDKANKTVVIKRFNLIRVECALKLKTVTFAPLCHHALKHFIFNDHTANIF